jgi:hypothetical protein
LTAILTHLFKLLEVANNDQLLQENADILEDLINKYGEIEGDGEAEAKGAIFWTL